MSDRLDEIAARLEKAASRPWTRIHGVPRLVMSGGAGPYRVVATTNVQPTSPTADEDATLIAHAPTDLDYLLTRLRAAEAVVKLDEMLDAHEVNFCEICIHPVKCSDWSQIAQAKRETIATWRQTGGGNA